MGQVKKLYIDPQELILTEIRHLGPFLEHLRGNSACTEEKLCIKSLLNIIRRCVHMFIPILFKHILQINLYIFKAACPSVSLWVTLVFVSHTHVGVHPSAQVMGDKHKLELLATLLLSGDNGIKLAFYEQLIFH